MEGEVDSGRGQDGAVVYNKHLPLSSNLVGLVQSLIYRIKIQSEAFSAKCSLDVQCSMWSIKRKFKCQIHTDYSHIITGKLMHQVCPRCTE